MTSRNSRIRRSPEADQPASFAGIRRYSRRTIDADVFVQDADGWEIPLEAADISPVGIFVESEYLFDLGDEHTLIFRAPDEQFVFRIPARVVRVAEGEEDEPAGMAYEFLGTEGEVWTKLCSIVAQS